MSELSQADQEYLALKEAIREAHGVLKDMKRERKELEALHKKLIENAEQTVVDVLSEAVVNGMKNLERSLDNIQNVLATKLDKKFEKLSDILLGEDDPSKPSLVELALEAKAKGKNFG